LLVDLILDQNVMAVNISDRSLCLIFNYSTKPVGSGKSVTYCSNISLNPVKTIFRSSLLPWVDVQIWVHSHI